MALVAGKAIRGEVKVVAHEVLEVETLADTAVGNVFNMNVEVNVSQGKKEWKEDHTPPWWKMGGTQNFNINIYYQSNMAALTVSSLCNPYLVFCSQQSCEVNVSLLFRKEKLSLKRLMYNAKAATKSRRGKGALRTRACLTPDRGKGAAVAE